MLPLDTGFFFNFIHYQCLKEEGIMPLFALYIVLKYLIYTLDGHIESSFYFKWTQAIFFVLTVLKGSRK